MSRPTGFGDVSDPFGEMDVDVEQNAGFNPPPTAAWERAPAAPAAPVYTQEDEPFTAADLAAASQAAVPAVTPAAAPPPVPAPALGFSASVGPGRDMSGRLGPPAPPPPPVPSVSRLSTAPEAALLGGAPSSSAPAPAEDPSSYPFYSIKRYRKFFNVDTDEVLARLFRAVVLFFRGDFFERLDTNPDLYGPFWIASTLVFVSAAAGNTASYIAYRKATGGGGGAAAPGSAGVHEAGWYYDVDKVGGSMGLFYGYIGVVGMAFWLVLRWFYKAQVGLAKVWCAYGYALAVYIPMAALCVLPMESVRWSLVGVSTATSGIFLLLNFRSLVVEAAGSQAVPVLMTMLGVHAILGLSLKLVFFHY